MAGNCTCPLATALTSITKEACGFDIGQIQRFAVERLGNSFLGDTDANDITKLSAWQTRIAASDSTKIVVSPMIGGDPVVVAGEAITNGGGDNSTLNGVVEHNGVNPSIFSCVFKSMAASNEREMKSLICEGRLRIYFFNMSGQIISQEVVIGAPAKEGFLADNLSLLDRNNAGFGASKDTNAFSMSLNQGWSNKLVVTNPEFNPLIDL